MPVIEGQPLSYPARDGARRSADLPSHPRPRNGQADRGHHVGIVADSLTGGERANRR